jgi:hypothetical protein
LLLLLPVPRWPSLKGVPCCCRLRILENPARNPFVLRLSAAVQVLAGRQDGKDCHQDLSAAAHPYSCLAVLATNRRLRFQSSSHVEDQQKNSVENNPVIVPNYNFLLQIAEVEEIISAYHRVGKRAVPKPEKRCLYARFASLIEGLGRTSGSAQ